MLNIAERIIGKDDRVYVNSINNLTIFLIADGAGGICGGSEAADLFISLSIEYITNNKNIISSYNLRELLFQIDSCISNDRNAGETSGLIIIISDNEIFGACVGDCEAWNFTNSEIYILTENQFRKPLLGSNLALPIMIENTKLGDSLILGTDGLFNYIGKDNLNFVKSINDPEVFSDYLIENLKINSDKFCDDVGFIIVKKF